MTEPSEDGRGKLAGGSDVYRREREAGVSQGSHTIVMGLKFKNKYFDKTWKCLELNGQKGKSPMRDLEVW